MLRLIALGAILFVTATLLTVTAAASGSGEISGKVLDPKSATVTGASVKLVNAAGTAIRQTTTDEKGNFQLEDIDPGGELEFVRAKPLGDRFVGVPVYEVRGAVLRPFLNRRMSLGANFLIASGYTGQTTETIPDQPQPCPTECVVGVPLKSYVSLSWTYYFKK
jgi:Carboxypeptidase regulatory-like domain